MLGQIARADRPESGRFGLEKPRWTRSRDWHGTWTVWDEPPVVARWGRRPKEIHMLHYALIFLVVAIIAAVLGFTGIAGAAAGIAKILAIVFLVLFVGSMIFGRKRA
jgi:uncharacterized membrane protein YtjA (UPF0391 family)